MEESKMTGCIYVSNVLYASLISTPLLTKRSLASTVNRFLACSVITTSSARSIVSVSVSARRSEEHTSELQSPCNLVCRLLLEKKTHLTKYDLSPDAAIAIVEDYDGNVIMWYGTNSSILQSPKPHLHPLLLAISFCSLFTNSA